jgi:glucose-6-phosphate isomerase
VIELLRTAGVAVTVDPASGALACSGELEVEELAMRPLDAARDVYERPPKKAPPLYHMANGITPRDCAEWDSALRYELTSLRPGLVGREWVKTIGHIHDAASDGVGYPEAYEVVAGEAIFVLFRPEPLICLLVEAGSGDRFVIPPGWHHLAVNTGAGAMVFADVVARAVVPDYTLLRARRGGPVYLGPDGVRPNPRYEVCRPLRLRASALPAAADHGRLADTFFGDRRRLAYLLEPARYREAWEAFEALVR